METYTRKRKIFNSIVRSIMMYEAEIWITNKQTTGNLLAVETKYWRRYLRGPKNKLKIKEFGKRMRVSSDLITYIE